MDPSETSLGGDEAKEVALPLNDSIVDEGTKHIASALQSNSAVMALDLINNGIEDEGTNAIARQREANTRFDRLLLSPDDIGNDDGAVYIEGTSAQQQQRWNSRCNGHCWR